MRVRFEVELECQPSGLWTMDVAEVEPDKEEPEYIWAFGGGGYATQSAALRELADLVDGKAPAGRSFPGLKGGD